MIRGSTRGEEKQRKEEGHRENTKRRWRVDEVLGEGRVGQK
jgi:hypothetical protein